MTNRFNLQGKTILVTGASSGFGYYMAELYASEGANVIICARRKSRLDQLQQHIQQHYSVQVSSYPLDVNDRVAIQAMLSDISDQKIKIDVLVNNAGIGLSNRFLDVTDEQWDSVVGTNLRAPWVCTQEVVKHMIEHQTQGAIINITSVLSQSVGVGIAPYCASKAGLRHLTEVMAVELARYKVRANAIAPGYMVTEINEEFLMSEGGQKMLKAIPMRRFMEFEDLAGALLLFASGASKGMTGVEVKIDGGHSLTTL